MVRQGTDPWEYYTLAFDATAWTAVGTPTDDTSFQKSSQPETSDGTETVIGFNAWWTDGCNYCESFYKFQPAEGYTNDGSITTVFDQRVDFAQEFTIHAFIFDTSVVDMYSVSGDGCSLDEIDCSVVVDESGDDGASSLVAAASAIAAVISLTFF